MLERDKKNKDRDEIFDTLKYAVKEEGMKNHQWDEKAEDSLVSLLTSQSFNKMNDKRKLSFPCFCSRIPAVNNINVIECFNHWNCFLCKFDIVF